MKPMSIEALRHVRSGGRVRYDGDKEIFLEPEPTGPTVAELIDQGYLSPTGRRLGFNPEIPSLKPNPDAKRPEILMIPPTTEYRFARHLEPRFSVEAHLQLMRVVAIIGWVAAILLALGV